MIACNCPWSANLSCWPTMNLKHSLRFLQSFSLVRRNNTSIGKVEKQRLNVLAFYIVTFTQTIHEKHRFMSWQADTYNEWISAMRGLAKVSPVAGYSQISHTLSCSRTADDNAKPKTVSTHWIRRDVWLGRQGTPMSERLDRGCYVFVFLIWVKTQTHESSGLNA